MVSDEILGVPEIPEYPSAPIFPSKEIERRPHPPGYDLVRARQARSEQEDGDLADLSTRGRAFNAVEVMFERIAQDFAERMRDGRNELVRLDLSRLESSILDRAEDPPLATANLMIGELQRIASETFGRVESVRTAAFEDFKANARDAVRSALEDAKRRLASENQLDDATSERLDATADAIVDGVANLVP